MFIGWIDAVSFYEFYELQFFCIVSKYYGIVLIAMAYCMNKGGSRFALQQDGSE
jgi:putative hemolysin